MNVAIDSSPQFLKEAPEYLPLKPDRDEPKKCLEPGIRAIRLESKNPISTGNQKDSSEK
jgi:hypothetical protein